MYSFITGSRAYGTPREKSDIDLVIRLEPEEYEKLKLLAKGHVVNKIIDEYSNAVTIPLRIGNVNFICCTTDEEYYLWKDGTDILCREKPVTRDRAVEVFQLLERQRGFRE